MTVAILYDKLMYLLLRVLVNSNNEICSTAFDAKNASKNNRINKSKIVPNIARKIIEKFNIPEAMQIIEITILIKKQN